MGFAFENLSARFALLRSRTIYSPDSPDSPDFSRELRELNNLLSCGLNSSPAVLNRFCSNTFVDFAHNKLA